MSEITKMHVLEQINEHRQNTLDKLSLLIVDFSESTQKHIAKEVKIISADVEEHLGHDDILIAQVRHHNDLQPEILKYEERKDRISNTLGQVAAQDKKDKDGLLQLLRQLSGELRVLAEFEELRLHKKISRYSSAEELENVYNQFLENKVCD
ncbi:hypothetical protein GC174_06120 [bacterium]|nr:hypothetical protein [bacterium]